jgi:hypothetical protein
VGKLIALRIEVVGAKEIVHKAPFLRGHGPALAALTLPHATQIRRKYYGISTPFACADAAGGL